MVGTRHAMAHPVSDGSVDYWVGQWVMDKRGDRCRVLNAKRINGRVILKVTGGVHPFVWASDTEPSDPPVTG